MPANRGAGNPATVRRYSRLTRWYHAATYLTVLVLLFTGWWLLAGGEGSPSPLARATGLADTTVHTYAGWVAAALAAVAVTVGARATRAFLAESVRVDPGDARWLVRWPAAVFTGRFRHHEGHFDPGQRLANVVLVVLLAVLIGSGVGLTLITGGAGFVWLQRVHRWATYLVTPVILGHILVASGVLPGYRGVARSMHLGGRLRRDVARRLWPGWLDRLERRPTRTGGHAAMRRRPPSCKQCPHTMSIAALLLGALPPDERSGMLQHLRSCEACQAEVLDLAPVPGLLNRLHPR
jgi:formate dehydrogenase subunit gamma